MMIIFRPIKHNNQTANTANANNNNNHIPGGSDGSSGVGNASATLRRHGSTISLQSQTLSTASGSSLKRANRSLREKVYEIETFKDILFGQIDTLQRYFDACAELNENAALATDGTTAQQLMGGTTLALNGTTSSDGHATGGLELGGDLRPIDFKVCFAVFLFLLQRVKGCKFSRGNFSLVQGESITFRATTNGVLTTLQHCLDIINERDESWKKRIDKEVERRRRSEGLTR